MPRTRHQKSIELSRDCRFPVFLFFSLGGRKCRNPTGFTQQSHKKALSLYLMRIKSQAVALVHRQSHRTPVSRHPQWQDLCTELRGQPAQMGLVFFGIKGTGAVNQVTALLKGGDRKSTRLNSSHVRISYAVFCLKKKKKKKKKT